MASHQGQQTSPAAKQSPTPAEFLKAVFARYRGTTTYRDRGRVTLTYQHNDTPITRSAPMRIWIDRGELDLAVYDVRLTIEQSRLMAWIIDHDTNHWDSQVLRRAGKADAETIADALADPILTSRINAGLAGPPPQLEWIFESNPMQGLFESGYRFSFIGEETIEGSFCRGVQAVDGFADGEQAQTLSSYRFWVDTRSSVIRRVDLPPVPLVAGSSDPTQQVSLSIDFIDASFDPPSDRDPRENFPEQPRFVRQLVSLPPVRPPTHWGEVPVHFQLTDSFGEPLLALGKGNVTILMRWTGDTTSFESLRFLEAWRQQTSAQEQPSIRWIVMSNNRSPDNFSATIEVAIDADGSTARALKLDQQIEGGNFVLINDQGQMVWSQPSLTAENMPGAQAILKDVLGGVDVAARLRTQWKEQVANYQQEIQQNLSQ